MALQVKQQTINRETEFTHTLGETVPGPRFQCYWVTDLTHIQELYYISCILSFGQIFLCLFKDVSSTV
jgi:hypothetical protein